MKTKLLFLTLVAGLFALPALGDEKAPAKGGTPIARLVKDLKSIVARERAKPTHDEALMKEIEKLATAYEKEVKPVRLADLTDEDRQLIEAEVRRKIEDERQAAGDPDAGGGPGGGGPGGGGWGAGWLARNVERVLEDVKLSEEQRAKAEGLLNEYARDAAVALQNQDYKLISDLKDDLEKNLTKEFGRPRAKDIMNNVNRYMSGGRGWGGGGGGR